MAEHTKLPWRIGKHGADDYVFREDGDMICTCSISEPEDASLDRANAAFIVRACNSHQAMIEALRGAKTLSEMAGNLPNLSDEARAAIQRRRDAIDAALKLAEAAP